MSVITQQNVTQNFLAELSKTSPKAEFTPFEKIAAALKYLEQNGLPNQKHEDYKYCNMEAVIRKEFKTLSSSFNLVSKDELKKFRKDKTALYIFVVNGKIDEANSDLKLLPKGLTITSIGNAFTKHKDWTEKHFGVYAKEDADAFIALNTAFAGNGIFIHVEKNAAVEKAVRLVYVDRVSETAAINFRNLVVVEENAQLNFSETFESRNSSANNFNNFLSEIYSGKSSVVKHQILQSGSERFYAVHTTQVHQESSSSYSVNTFTLGGALVRNNLNIVVNGQHAETHLNGLVICKATQLVDNHTVVDHAQANCESNELYKGIADGKSTLVFNGKIFVRRDSQKINAYQSSKNILLSDDATVDTKPQLEIFANDVKCSHGTSTGKVDEEAMFYLKSRGIGEERARKLLLHAFAGEVVEKISDEAFKQEILDKLEAALTE
jgi:Fe-S cluster assembly protein SufD